MQGAVGEEKRAGAGSIRSLFLQVAKVGRRAGVLFAQTGLEAYLVPLGGAARGTLPCGCGSVTRSGVRRTLGGIARSAVRFGLDSDILAQAAGGKK